MENKEVTKYLERIEIKGLWGRYDVDWKLNPDVNILVGENGTGKSTILTMVNNFFQDFFVTNKNLEKVFKKIEITYWTGKESTTEKGIAFKGTFTKTTDPSQFASGYSIKLDSYSKNSLNVKLLSTFDNELKISDIDRKFYPDLNTELDFYLDKAIAFYKDYQLNLSKKIINQKQNIDIVYKKKEYFIETINRLFALTEKVIDEDDNGIVFLFSDGTKINITDLSSGEKQLLLILLTVLCQDENPSVLLLDEPEISLHFSWQHELVKNIRILNPNCQVIIATHSTSIFTKGWMNKIFFIDGVENERIRHKITQKV